MSTLPFLLPSLLHVNPSVLTHTHFPFKNTVSGNELVCACVYGELINDVIGLFCFPMIPDG